MPWFITLYFAGFITFSIWSVIDNFRKKSQLLPVELLSDVFLVALALAYWLPGVREVLFDGALQIFLIGVFCLLAYVVIDFRGRFPDYELSFEGNVFVAYFGIVLIVAFHAPLVYWAYRVAVVESYANT